MIEIDLPPPISANRLWDRSRNGVYLSKQYRVWLRHADSLSLMQKQWRNKKITGQFSAVLYVDESKVNRRSDPDNYLKAALDYAKRIGLIVDDSAQYSRNPQVKFGHAPSGSKLVLTPLRNNSPCERESA